MFRLNELIEITKGAPVKEGPDGIIRGISIDSRTIRRGDAFIAIKGDNFDGHDFIPQAASKGAVCIIKQRGRISRRDPGGVSFIEVTDTIRALGDIARSWRRGFNIPVIAVTGSNGKTTTKDMTAHILSARFNVLKNEGTKNNQIGLPMTLLKLKAGCDMAVLELGTNHFGEIGYLAGVSEPNIGIITNIGPSHLEHLRNLSGVLREKSAVVEGLASPRIAILNADDGLLKKRIAKGRAKENIFTFGINSPADFSASDLGSRGNRTGFLVNKKYGFTLNTVGYYNIYNALAAAAAGRIFGLTYRDIILRLNSFVFPKGRLNLVRSGGVRFIDDTYNSNPLSLECALKALCGIKTAGRKIFVMGDMLELGASEETFHRRAGLAAAGCCDVFIAVGRLSRLAAEAAAGAGVSCRNDGKVFACRSASEARKILFGELSLTKNDLVLVKGSRRMKMEEVFKS